MGKCYEHYWEDRAEEIRETMIRNLLDGWDRSADAREQQRRAPGKLDKSGGVAIRAFGVLEQLADKEDLPF